MPALGCSRLLPPFRPYRPPSTTVWPLLQLHAARVAFLAFAALADVDTTVASDGDGSWTRTRTRRGTRTDTETDADAETEMEMKADESA